MTNFTRIRNTFMSNPKGIMDFTLPFGLQAKMKANVELYFYKYNIFDLIEVEYIDNCIFVYDFNHTKNRADKIKDNVEFYSGYFKSAELRGKRFLFDIELGLPVNYCDFIKMDKIPDVKKDNFVFLLDMKNGYITEKDSVYIFVTIERSNAIDKCVISFMNNSVGIKNPRSELSLDACVSDIIISGLLSGVEFDDIKEQLDMVDWETKFISTIRDLKFGSKYISDKLSKLNVDKFKRILNKKDNNIIPFEEGKIIEKIIGKNEVSLRDVIDMGLDKFVKQLEQNKMYKVIIDTEYQNIKSAYILKGMMVIIPHTLIHLNHFKELLDSDNVEYALH